MIIINPINKSKHSILSKNGINILKQYIRKYMTKGGRILWNRFMFVGTNPQGQAEADLLNTLGIRYNGRTGPCKGYTDFIIGNNTGRFFRGDLRQTFKLLRSGHKRYVIRLLLVSIKKRLEDSELILTKKMTEFGLGPEETLGRMSGLEMNAWRGHMIILKAFAGLLWDFFTPKERVRKLNVTKKDSKVSWIGSSLKHDDLLSMIIEYINDQHIRYTPPQISDEGGPECCNVGLVKNVGSLCRICYKCEEHCECDDGALLLDYGAEGEEEEPLSPVKTRSKAS